MLGAIIGDTAGSRFEFHNRKSKNFTLLTREDELTDDSMMTIAIAGALLESREDFSDLSELTVRWMRKVGCAFPHAGYGGRFAAWLFSAKPHPYNSFGNGSAMRVSAVAYAARSLEQVKLLSAKVTEVTHNHPEGMKGAEATAVAIYMARQGAGRKEIAAAMGEYYDLNFTLAGIRPFYRFDVSCMGTMPVAIVAFLESESFEDAIRNAISVGGDSDTLAAITGSIAEAFYGIPEELEQQIKGYIPASLLSIVEAFEDKYGKGRCC